MQQAGFRVTQIERMSALIEAHIAEGRYPGAQAALACNGKVDITVLQVITHRAGFPSAPAIEEIG